MVCRIPSFGLFLIVCTLLSAQSKIPPKVPLRQFSVEEAGGALHILRSQHGPFNSFAELKDQIRHTSGRNYSSSGSAHALIASSVNFVVSNSSDEADSDLEDGIYSPPTLRSAIQNANLLGGSHAISFASGLTKISPLTQLPAVAVNITIDGTVSAGKIIIDGFLSSGSFGLSIGKPSVIKNIIFEWWKSAGLALSFGSDNSVVQRNEFVYNNVGLNINSDSSVIGGNDPADKNIAHSNTQDGIAVVFGDGNLIQNNYCGTSNGSSRSPNFNSGLYVLGERNRVISNIFSGNDDAGLEIGEFSDRTLIWKNTIGLTADGSTRLPNYGNGITTFGDRDSIINNVIASNGYGITVLGQSSRTYIGNNTIGPNTAMDSLIGNRYGGIQVLGELTVIEKNIISANKFNGISLTGLGGAVIRKNFIGTDPNGTADWGNSSSGIYISCNNNVIGGESPTDQNIISGNDGSGIELYGGIIFSFPGPSGPNYVLNNVIQYNLIGTTKSGNSIIANSTGIVLWGYVDSTVVYNNLVSGNQKHGIWLRPANGDPSYNWISANYIGTNLSGTGPLPNTGAGICIDGGEQNIIGGPAENYLNVISGNTGPGVWINGGYFNTVKANVIGLNASASLSLPNGLTGVRITGESVENVIEWNHISGNSSSGVSIESSAGKIPEGNVIITNTIGLNSDQTAPLPNTGEGIFVYNARNTWIGGSTLDSANFIAGNFGPGIQIEGDTAVENSVWGNFIGTNGSGNAAVPNARGIVLYMAGHNSIGGTVQGSGNLISGNSGEGIYLYGADSNRISRNIVGLSLNETALLPNNYSGIVVDSSHHNLIGLPAANNGNSVSGNLLTGIVLFNSSSGNWLYNNSVGTDYTGTKQFGNKLDGISIYGGAHNNWIGSTGAGNMIRFNTLAGILIADSSRNRISGNSFEANGELGIDLYTGIFGVTVNDDYDTDAGANDLQNFPELSFADGPSPLRISGRLRSAPNDFYTVEFFESDSFDPSKHGEGKRYVGSALIFTDSLGTGLINSTLAASVPTGNFITATATDGSGNTSEFSLGIPVIASGIYADLAASMNAHRDSVKKSDTLLYHITVTNIGPDSATNILLKDTLSKRMNYLADSTTKGTSSFSGGVLTVTVPALKAGEQFMVVLAVRADSAGVLTNAVSVTALQNDPVLSNNTGRDSAVVTAPLSAGSNAALPASFTLYQNFPNPFNPSTMIRFDLPVSANVTLTIYDLLGREVATVLNEFKGPGRHSVEWNGAAFSSGVYFYRLQAENFIVTRKLLLQK